MSRIPSTAKFRVPIGARTSWWLHSTVRRYDLATGISLLMNQIPRGCCDTTGMIEDLGLLYFSGGLVLRNQAWCAPHHPKAVQLEVPDRMDL